jgi:Protein of unknown function (DUF2924)
MPRVKIGPALPDREKLDAEIARLRDLDVGQLRSRWHTAFGRPAPAHLARHLLFRSLAYRLQADRLGDLDGESQRLLDRASARHHPGTRRGTPLFGDRRSRVCSAHHKLEAVADRGY